MELINNNAAFQPVTLVLQTIEELSALRQVAVLAFESAVADSDVETFASDLRDLLTSHA